MSLGGLGRGVAMKLYDMTTHSSRLVVDFPSLGLFSLCQYFPFRELGRKPRWRWPCSGHPIADSVVLRSLQQQLYCS